jgi:TolB-like protein
MNRILFFIAFSFLSNFLNSQNFDAEIEKSAKEMSVKLNQYGKLNVAVYPFYPSKKELNELSLLISEELSIYLLKHKTNFKLIDRSYLDQMLQEHKLNSEGLIDPATAKRFGMIIAADFYITGKVYVIDDIVRIQLHAINTETGERLYSDFAKFTLDKTIAEIAGIKNYKEVKDESELHRSHNSKCNEQKVGDYCFVNNSNKHALVYLEKMGNAYMFFGAEELRISPGEKECFMNLEEGYKYEYMIFLDSNPYNLGTFRNPDSKGNITIVKCESNYKIIK